MGNDSDTHRKKRFGITAFNDSKKYCSLIKVSIDFQTLKKTHQNPTTNNKP